MDGILNWMKEFLIIYLILTILTNLTASDQYKKHLNFFSGVVLILTFISPLLGYFGEAGRLESLISYEEFWEKLDSARQDTSKLEFMQDSHYISRYEQAIAEDMEEKARSRQLPVSRIQVRLTKKYEIEQVSVWLDILQDAEPGEVQSEKLIRFFMNTYGLEETQIYIN